MRLRETVKLPLFRGWQRESVHRACCHGEDTQRSTFPPSRFVAMRPGGTSETRDQFLDILVNARSDKEMPTAAKIGIDSTCIGGLHHDLKGWSEGRYHGGRLERQGK